MKELHAFHGTFFIKGQQLTSNISQIILHFIYFTVPL
jgi:hypothetical protein